LFHKVPLVFIVKRFRWRIRCNWCFSLSTWHLLLLALNMLSKQIRERWCMCVRLIFKGIHFDSLQLRFCFDVCFKLAQRWICRHKRSFEQSGCSIYGLDLWLLHILNLWVVVRRFGIHNVGDTTHYRTIIEGLRCAVDQIKSLHLRFFVYRIISIWELIFFLLLLESNLLWL